MINISIIKKVSLVAVLSLALSPVLVSAQEGTAGTGSVPAPVPVSEGNRLQQYLNEIKGKRDAIKTEAQENRENFKTQREQTREDFKTAKDAAVGQPKEARKDLLDVFKD